MKAIQMFETGGPEVLRLVDVPVPAPGPKEALIKIEACGVNFIDTYFREGRYSAPLPYTLGQEAAGIVEEVGSEVTTVKVGDKVAWCGVPGTYAEYAVAPADRLVHVPDGLSSQQAAAAMLQGMTAHYLAQTTYVIHAGDTVLVHAGAGGVGLLLTQMAKRLGAWVITTVSTEEKAELSRAAGADEVIFYNQEPFEVAVRRITEGVGVPVVYDSVGKTTFEQSLKCLAPLGMMVLYGASSGAVPPFDLIRLSQMGSLFVTRPTLKDYIGPRKYLEWRAADVLGWIDEGALKLRMEYSYPLADAAEAHRALEGRKTTGKVLLIP
jgi:NADPH2:quinone reductase